MRSASPSAVRGRQRFQPEVSLVCREARERTHNREEYVPAAVEDVVHDVKPVFRAAGNGARGRQIEVTSCASAIETQA